MAHETRGQIEARISEAVIKFEKEYMGRGPEETQSFIIKDMILVRLKKVLTPAEEHLSKSAVGSELIKRTRASLLEGSRSLLEDIITEITGIKVKSLHTDISTKTGERMIIFTMEKTLEKKAR